MREARETVDHPIQSGGQQGGTVDQALPAPIDIRSAALSLVALVAIVFALRSAQEVLIPVVLAALISYALDPIVTRVCGLRIHRAIASALVLIVLTAGLAAGAWAMRTQFVSFLEDLPVAAQRLRQSVRSTMGGSDGGTLTQIRKAAKELEKTASEAVGPDRSPSGVTPVQIKEPAFDANQYLRQWSQQVFGFAGQAMMIFFLVYFLLASGDLYKRKLVKITGRTLSQKRLTVEIINEINAQIGKFLLVQVLTTVVVGVATALALSWLGLDQPAVWGLAAGVFNTIPYFGPLLVTAGLAIVALLQFGTLSMAIWVCLVAFAITAVEGFLLTPALLGRASGINQVAIFISLLFWSWVWGVVGMILAVPIMMAIKTVCDRVEDLQPVGELLGER